MRFLRDNSLSVFFLLLLLVSIAGQSLAGWHEYNFEQLAHNEPAVSWGYYVTSSSFWAAVMENWQSEFLQFSFFIAATIWLIQRGSTNQSRLRIVVLNPTKDSRSAAMRLRMHPAGRVRAAGVPLCTRTPFSSS
jgi:Domain of unknown function (DUF6766)